jgi:hypothetical protein
VIKRADLGKDQIMVMNMCGRGDKDIFTVAEILGGEAVMPTTASRSRFAETEAEGPRRRW